jgi:hypothetical protein
MKTRLRSLLIASTAVATVIGNASAQQQRPADSTSRSPVKTARPARPVLIALIGGPGVETPTPYLFESDGNIYQTQKRPMVFELEVSKTLLASRGRKTFFEYFVSAQPLVSVGGNVRYQFGPCLSPTCFSVGTQIIEQRYTSYGAGVTPLGARMTTSLPFGARFSASLGAGAVLLNKAIPYDKAKRLNFQITARPAIGIPIRNHGTLWAGYELFHMSNANTSPINPGINAGLVMFGFQRGR